MTDPFVSSEVDKTKSRWLASAFRQFGRKRTTLRAFFYYLLTRSEPDYPICGGFVGEIRVTRPYHESDGDRLQKWASKATSLGFVPRDALLIETSDELQLLPHETPSPNLCGKRLEMWVFKTALHTLLRPVAEKYSVPLISIPGSPPEGTVSALIDRCLMPTTVLCMSDLSAEGLELCSKLQQSIDERRHGRIDINVKRIALTPEQVIEMKIPMVPAKRCGRAAQDKFKRYLKPYGLDERRMAETDALEIFYPGGAAGFAEDEIKRACSFDEHGLYIKWV